MGHLAKLLLALWVFLFVFSDNVISSENILQNPSFESNSETSFAPWSKTPSTLSLSVSSTSGMTHHGNFSARFKSQSTSTKYLYQVIASPSGSYRFSAWLRLLNVDQAGFVRLSWYSTSDGSGSELSSSDSPVISTVGDWQRIEVISQTPASAHSLRTKLALDPSTANVSEILFDEAVLESVDPTPDLSFAVTLPSEVNMGEEFSLDVSLKGLSPISKYYLKVLGDQGTKLTGELFNFYTWSPLKNSFLAWNATWTDFPFLTTDSSGQGAVEAKGKFASDSFVGENKVVIRLRKDGTNANIDSDAISITVHQPEAKQILVDDGKKEPAIPGPFLTTANKTFVTNLDFNDPEGTTTSGRTTSESGEVLAVENSIPLELTLSPSSEKESPDSENKGESSFPWEAPLLLIGGLFLMSSLVTVIVKGGGWSLVKGFFLSE